MDFIEAMYIVWDAIKAVGIVVLWIVLIYVAEALGIMLKSKAESIKDESDANIMLKRQRFTKELVDMMAEDARHRVDCAIYDLTVRNKQYDVTNFDKDVNEIVKEIFNAYLPELTKSKVCKDSNAIMEQLERIVIVYLSSSILEYNKRFHSGDNNM